jgi:hypothetical protein
MMLNDEHNITKCLSLHAHIHNHLVTNWFALSHENALLATRYSTHIYTVFDIYIHFILLRFLIYFLIKYVNSTVGLCIVLMIIV